MNQAAAKGTGGYLFGEDYVDQSFDRVQATPEEMRAKAHIANGGDQQFTCPACKGRGRFISYAGRDVGPCFKCKGKKVVSKGVAAAAKGKATKEANKAQWMEANLDAVMYANKRRDKGSAFYQSLIEKLNAYGTWNDRQVEMIRADMAKDAEFWAKKKAEQAAAAPVIEISAIEALFAKAVDNDVKRPIFRADGLEISKAPATGKNAGALYVKAGGEYAGKIVGGKFHKVYAAPAEVVDRLMAVAADPLKEAMAYGRKFGNCALCGRGLVDPVSIRALVGPICAPKWGLDWKREAAREELAAEKEHE